MDFRTCEHLVETTDLERAREQSIDEHFVQECSMSRHGGSAEFAAIQACEEIEEWWRHTERANRIVHLHGLVSRGYAAWVDDLRSDDEVLHVNGTISTVTGEQWRDDDPDVLFVWLDGAAEPVRWDRARIVAIPTEQVRRDA